MAYSAKIRDVISQFINRVLGRTRKVILLFMGGMYMYYKNTVIQVIGGCSLELKIASPRQLVACSFKLKCHLNISCFVRLTEMYSEGVDIEVIRIVSEGRSEFEYVIRLHSSATG